MSNAKQVFKFSYKGYDEEVVLDVVFDKDGCATTYDVFTKFLGFLSTAYGYPVDEKDLLEWREELA